MEKRTIDFVTYAELRIPDPGENKLKICHLLFCVHIYFVWCRNENYSE